MSGAQPLPDRVLRTAINDAILKAGVAPGEQRTIQLTSGTMTFTVADGHGLERSVTVPVAYQVAPVSL